MRGTDKVPSASLVAALMKILAPGLSSALSAGAYVTIGQSGPTAIFFSPSLYLSVSEWSPTAVTIWSTVALVMVLCGWRSQGRWPSPVPRIASGKMWISMQRWLPSACGMPVTPMKEPCLMSE